MRMTKKLASYDIKHPISLEGREFVYNKFAYYQWFREEAPVYKGKFNIFDAYFVSRYEDCVLALKDPRFVRNRSTATGGGRFPLPLPGIFKLLMETMLNQDGSEHRRMRAVVHKAFNSSIVLKIEERIERLTHELLDQAEKQGEVDLIQAYSLPLPLTITAEIIGIQTEDLAVLQQGISSIIQGLSGWKAIPMSIWYFPWFVKLGQQIISKKRKNPANDFLTRLIHAKEESDELTEDELVVTVLMLITASYETTLSLITNSVATLLQHPDQLAKLRAEPDLMPSTVEEILRFCSPVYCTQMIYAASDITLHGVTIPKGEAVLPLLGAANRDPAVFDNPDTFDITRTPNKHLGFGYGLHYCLGTPLARIEAQIALKTLLDRNPNLRLAVKPEELTLGRVATFHNYKSLPVLLG